MGSYARVGVSRMARLTKCTLILLPCNWVLADRALAFLVPLQISILYVPNSRRSSGRYVRSKMTSIYDHHSPWRFTHSTSALLSIITIIINVFQAESRGVLLTGPVAQSCPFPGKVWSVSSDGNMRKASSSIKQDTFTSMVPAISICAQRSGASLSAVPGSMPSTNDLRNNAAVQEPPGLPPV